MKIALIGCCAALVLTLPVQAQTVSSPAPVATTQDIEPAPQPPTNAGAFDALSPGGQKIARALHAAQTSVVVTTGEGSPATAGWSLDDVAAARSQGGWGSAFKQMKAEGLVSARNLGEVVSGRTATATPPVRQTPVVVSYGNSDAATVATGGKAHRNSATTIVTAAGGGGGAPIAAKALGNGHAAATAATITKANGGGNHAGGKGKSGKHGR